MNLEKHISSLLYHHDCVVVPEFGAFIAQKTNSIYQKESATFLPPQKQLAFNPSITKNDGILIQELGQLEGLNFEEAKERVESAVLFWKKQLDSNTTLSLEGLGALSKSKDGLIQFDPKHPNFLLASYGLESIKAEYILPEIEKVQSTSAVWWKVAAVIPILLGGFLYFGKPQPVTDFVNQQWSGFVSPVLNPNIKAAKAVESPIKVIEQKAEAYKIEVEEAAIIHNHQVIAGAFRKLEEADAMVEILKNKGYDRALLTQKKGKYYYVAFDTFSNEEDASDYRREVASDFPETWVLSL